MGTGRRDAFRPSTVFLCLVAAFVVSGWMSWVGFGAAGVNVEDLAIDHELQGGSGALRIWVAGRDALSAAIEVLPPLQAGPIVSGKLMTSGEGEACVSPADRSVTVGRA